MRALCLIQYPFLQDALMEEMYIISLLESKFEDVMTCNWRFIYSATFV